ncbi:helix-turn-helix domain-containing protein [Croceicoccus sediminis]|uniref:helix-turn-helix domain-containing protein n=1 Tax=Croceicoccus sediminis TaxID=2571150 RepID=UPI0014789896|nr:helix-turn-helix domain-containing protein [Croceicoccus sediminis]
MNDIEDGSQPEIETTETVSAAPVAVGARLQAERERQGLTREEIGERTKIAERHLTSIEEGRFTDLPGRTYAVGFARSYARALGLDENEIVEGVRDEMGVAAPQVPERKLDYMEPGDPARVPSSKLAWGVAALLIVLIVIGAFTWKGFFVPAADLPTLGDENVEVVAAPTATPTPTETAAPTGEVAFTATVEGVWVKFYNRSGRQLFQKQMAEGEKFTIPADADGPQIWTGRPDAFTITVGGQQVAPLATEQTTIRDVPVDAESLTSRPAGPGLPTRG